jgi:starvation-inducible DNA-binding protein
MKLNTGINEEKRVEIAKGLSELLAETYTLYLKTHKYHWNVTGSMFQTLHLMFEGQYTALALAVDLVAERIRVMDVKAPGSYSEFAEISRVSDHEQIVRTAKAILPVIDGANDEGTNSLLGARIEFHEKTAWMLRSLIG